MPDLASSLFSAPVVTGDGRARAGDAAWLVGGDGPRRPGPAARVLLGLIAGYRRVLSPVAPALFGAACGCRFAPTCSQYAAEAVRTHGAAAGGWLALRRLVKCAPWHRGGLDPVPRPRCRRTAPRP